MTGYRCMPRARLVAGSHAIRALTPVDIEPIRRWRNAQLSVLRQQAPVTIAAQVAYFERAIWPQMARVEPDTILVAIERDGVMIGYGGLVHIAWPHRRAELSFLLDPAIAADAGGYGESFAAFLDLIRTLAFDDLRLLRVFTETYAIRTAHIAVLEATGMVAEGVLRDHVRIDGRGVDSLIHGSLAGEW